MILSLFLTMFFLYAAPVAAENVISDKALKELEQKYEFLEALRVMETHVKDFPEDYAVQFRIANYLFYGRKGVAADRQKARMIYGTLLRSLIEMQNKTPEILYMTGIAVSNSSGDTVSAFKWLMESANQGYPPAEAEVAFR